MRVQFNDGQEIIRDDLNELQQAKEREIYDRVVYEMLQRTVDGFFGGSCLVTYVNATTVQVAAGLGIQYDSSQTTPEPTKRPVYVASNTNKTISAAHATLDRIDIISIKAARATSESESRRYKATISSTPTTQSMVTKTDWAADIVVTAGTAAGSPAAPATPAGYIKIAEVLVTAATGVSGSGSVTDTRTILDSVKLDLARTWSAINTFTKQLVLGQLANGSVATPASGYKSLFLDTDNQIKTKDSTGAVAVVGAGGWSDVVFKTSADSPITIAQTDSGKIFVCDTSSGAIVINLPAVSGIVTPFHIGVKLLTGSNAVTINRNGTDTIDGATSKSLSVVGSACDLIPDTDPAPDKWTALDFGSIASFTTDVFSGNASTTGFTLSVSPGSVNNMNVFIGGVYQQKTNYSVSGTTLTFSTAPPVGTNNIEVVSGTSASIGTPGDGTVTKSKLTDSALFDDVTTTSSTPYTATQAEDTIVVNATGGAKTVNLPAAASNTGKRIRIIKSDSSSNAVTIDGNASETINGSTTTTLNTQYECLEIVCDGSNWYIVKRHIPSEWVSTTFAGSWVSNTTYAGFSRRVGDSLECEVEISLTGAPTATGLTLTIPNSLSIDTAKISSTTANEHIFGVCAVLDAGTTWWVTGQICYNNSTSVVVMGPKPAASPNQATQVTEASPMTFANNDRINIRFTVPISGWKG